LHLRPQLLVVAFAPPPLLSPCTVPLPPRSPLFPYTTLFRSVQAALDSAAASVTLTSSIESPLSKTASPYISMLILLNYYNTERLDRKSTRLNSSHVSISYAVFCLKKKIQNSISFYVILVTGI